jgi:hypothetical protein
MMTSSTDTNRDDLEVTQARASDEPEASPYRDDLEAARARVSNLEREADELRKRNAELERPAPPAKPTRFVAAMTSATRWSVLAALVAVTGPRRFGDHADTPQPVVSSVFLGIALVCWWCSGFRSPWARR